MKNNRSPKESWEGLKKALFIIQEEFEDRNGLPYCKNCGMDYGQLVTDIEKIISKWLQQERIRGLKEGLELVDKMIDEKLARSKSK